MLTLQNILDSDSISTLVAKLNANFQTISLSNGGPQGIRGEQGIPGLPGKPGATGPTGPIGATGPNFGGIIPFSLITGTTFTTIAGIPQSIQSYDFLTNPLNTTWGPTGPFDNQVWFDNNQLGWWKYLIVPDPDASDPDIGGDIEPGTANYSLANGWAGPDWYFYPLNATSLTGSGGGWDLDKTNYLGRIASGYSSPASITNFIPQEPFGIPNVRMTSKFGTVWISSMDKEAFATGPGGGPENNDTSLIYFWDYVFNVRRNSGIDRSLFKMSIDGPRYFDNMKARGFRFDELPLSLIVGNPYQVNSGGTLIDVPDTTPTIDPVIAYGKLQANFAQPLYNVSLDAYSPIMFFSNRNEATPDNATTLGYYQYSPFQEAFGEVHLFSTRAGIDDPFINDIIQPLTGSTNVAETVWDVRRLLTTNQFVNTFPQDTPDYTSMATGPSEVRTPYAPISQTQIPLVEWGKPYAWHGFQGYHSLFSAEKIINSASSGTTENFTLDQWIYENRQSWYGTSIPIKLPNFLDNDTTGGQGTGTQELLRSAGMMIRGNSDVEGGGNYDGVIIYTANSVGSTTSDYPTSATGPIIDYLATNHLLSLPSAYFSFTRNVGIGTVAQDKAGLFEPIARLHTHADWRPAAETKALLEDLTGTINQGSYFGINKTWLTYTNYVPKRRLKSAAFTIDRSSPELIYGIGSGGVFSNATQWPTLAKASSVFADWYDRGVFNDILMGSVDSPYHQNSLPGSTNTTYLKPSAAIRYESFNYDGDIEIERARPDNNWGWEWKGALRLGSSSRYTGTLGVPNSLDEIGTDSNYQNLEFQLHMVPLLYSNESGTLNPTANSMITGVGVHSLYPRTRLHVFGKNIYQEFRFDEPNTPGLVQSNATVSSTMSRSSWQNLKSSNQITIDYLGDTYIYNAAAFDYSYDYTVRLSTVSSFTQWSSNARNNPSKETDIPLLGTGTSRSVTRSTFNSTNNISTLSINQSVFPTIPTLVGSNALHGGLNNAAWDLDKYVGFNLFRDLLARGDEKGESLSDTTYYNRIGVTDQYASTWRLGTAESGDTTNGGSAILTDSKGRMGFTFIPDTRNGGRNYGRFEQHGIGTRDVVNNVKIVFDSYGNIGIGNAAGYDRDAYPSLYWDPATMKINYLPNANGAAALPYLVGPGSYGSLGLAPWTPGTYDYYGYSTTAVYGVNNRSETVNKLATQGEYVRMEIAAEKATGRPGHHPEKRGYGYPGWLMTTGYLPTGTGGVVIITDNPQNSFANRYIGIAPSTAGWGGAVHTFTFDNIGRLMSYTSTATAWTNGTYNIYTNYPNFALPHPADFGPDGPFTPGLNVVDYPWTTGMTLSVSINGVTMSGSNKIWIPTGAVAAEAGEITAAEGLLSEVSFAYDELQPANVRLNNFVYGDGYEFIRSSGDSIATTNVVDGSSSSTIDIFLKRTSSPKLVLTYGSVDYASMTAAGISTINQETLVNAGVAPLMKVTTVIESDQDETSLRTYTIPKTANTGGSFMVITDHMGQTEKADPGLAALPQNLEKGRIVLEKVVAHEVVRTGRLRTDQTPDPGFIPGAIFSGNWIAYPTSYELLPIHYVAGKNVTDLACEQILNDPTNLVGGGDALNIYGAQISRSLESYWDIDNTTFESPYRDAGTTTQEVFNKSEIRYRRLNSNYVMLDFNIDVKALAFDTLINCNPAEDEWNDHGDTGAILGARVTAFPSVTDPLAAYVHSPYAPGHLLSSISYFPLEGRPEEAAKNVWVGVDARWVQYLRFSYNVQDDAFSAGVDDPYYYEREFGGGPAFNNWNEYRAWYHGTGTVGASGGSAFLDFNYRNLWGAFGYNQTDSITSTTDFPLSPAFGGTGYVQPTDGTPYSPWTTGIAPLDETSYKLDECIKYWNGRLNDWFYSRWIQTDTSSGPPTPSANWDSQGTIYTGNATNLFTPDTPFENAYPGFSGAGSTFTNSEAISSSSFVWPATPGERTASQTTPNNPWINQYAYKLLWKWWQPFNWSLAFPSSSLNTPQFLYTEHTRSFDAIINRAFGDRAWVRSGNMQWKVTPTGKGTATQETGVGTAEKSADNVTFVIEVMFDQPLFVSGRQIYDFGNNNGSYAKDPEDHCSDGTVTAGNLANYKQHVRNQILFSGATYVTDGTSSNDIGYLSPLSNLTVRGQAIVKYKPTQYYESSEVTGG